LDPLLKGQDGRQERPVKDLTKRDLSGQNRPSVSDNTTANEPPLPVRQLSALELKALIESGAPFELEGFRNLYNLQGGIDAWSPFVDSSVPQY
jgi:hypothetical protein